MRARPRRSAGAASPLAALRGAPVLHWHGDTFDLPPAATLLASTDITPHQAFQAGAGQLALQFHAEADAARMEHWLMGHACELAAAGLDFSNVVKTTVFIADMNDFPKVNEVYKKYFCEPFPARSCVAIKSLPLGAQVEVEAIAAL